MTTGSVSSPTICSLGLSLHVRALARHEHGRGERYYKPYPLATKDERPGEDCRTRRQRPWRSLGCVVGLRARHSDVDT